MANLFRSAKDAIFHNIASIPGWRTSRKIVVIESDDWGSIRMPSSQVIEKFINSGFNLNNSSYNKFDALETNEDLSLLFEVLKSFRDYRGSHPVITANIVVGNPDFTMIRESDFKQYYFEPVTETLKKYPSRDQVSGLWKRGLTERIFVPQFHGREHVNIVRWMNALRDGSPNLMFAFDNETTFSGVGDYNFMEVLDFNSTTDLKIMKESLAEGINIFEGIFGYKSASFIPPCYTWSNEIEETLYEGGIKYIQGLIIQSIPTGTFGNYRRKFNFLGNRNKYGQYYLVRNCFFEPSLSSTPDVVENCLYRIGIAFRWHKPAIICSHRINYIGALDRANRNRSLSLLNNLLSKIILTWPDVEFMSSDQLGDIIAGEQ